MSGIFDQIINYSPPLIVSGTVNYKGTWNASTNNPTLNSSPAASTKGDYYVVSTAGTQFGITFAIGDWIISNGTAWEKVDLTDAVSSVFGRTGAVVGASTDYSSVGLTNTAIGASSPSTGAFTTVTASSTIAATGAVTGSNLSGTNTGDQTITLTGGVTGSGTGSFATTVVTNANLTGAVTSVGNATSLGSFTSANLAGALTDETGSGAAVFATSPTLVTPILGTPSSGTLTSCTGLPISTGVSGLGTGIATALAVNSGSTGAPALLGSAGAFTTLSATLDITASGGNILNTSGGTIPIRVSGATTGSAVARFSNTGGDTFFGAEGNATNNLIVGCTAYDTIIRGPSGIAFSANAGSNMQMRLSSTGLAVTGALSASGTATIGANNTSTGLALLQMLGGSGTNGGASVRFGTNGTAYSEIGQASGILGGTSTDLLFYANNGGQNIKFYAGGAGGVATISSTGLAVTGEVLSATLRFNRSNGAAWDSNGTRFQIDGTTYSKIGMNDSSNLRMSSGLVVDGALSKGSGSFRIEHPLPEKSATHQLVHSFIEGPQADLIYRGKVVLIDGKASVNIDAAATMTEGTFEVLCRDVQCFTTNESGWTAVRGKVTGNILTIEAKDADCVDEISWMVIGERQDPHMMETDWTDDNGKVIVEPLKPSIESN